MHLCGTLLGPGPVDSSNVDVVNDAAERVLRYIPREHPRNTTRLQLVQDYNSYSIAKTLDHYMNGTFVFWSHIDLPCVAVDLDGPAFNAVSTSMGLSESSSDPQCFKRSLKAGATTFDLVLSSMIDL